MGERKLNILESVIQYWVGPKRTNVYVESESQLIRKTPIQPSLVGAAAAASFEESKRKLNPSPNTSR